MWYIYIYITCDIYIRRYIYQKTLPKWLRNICLTKKCVFSDFENIAHCCYNGFEEDIYIYIYSIHIYLYIHTYNIYKNELGRASSALCALYIDS